MKTLIAIVLVATLAFAGAYVFVSSQRAAEHAAEKAAMQDAWRKTREGLENDLRKARNRTPRVEEVTREVEVRVAEKRDPQLLIDELIALKSQRGMAREVWQREIIHKFEGLAEIGQPSLPAIKGFLAVNQDVQYGRSAEDEEKELARQAVSLKPGEAKKREIAGDRTTEFFRSVRMKLPDGTFLNPPSLRLGLMEVAYRIGGPEAELLLAETLRAAVRGVEVAWLTAWLEKIEKGKYRELAVAVASDLLTHPVSIPGGSRDDRLARSYLFTVLNHFGDRSFIAEARKQLINAEGRLDQSIAAYLESTLGEQAMAVVLQAYNDPRLEGGLERARLVSMGMQHFGTNPQANEMFRTLVGSGSKDDGWNRYFAIASLDGGGMPRVNDQPVPSDPRVIQSRLELIESVQEVELDPKALDLMTRTYQNLQALSRGESIPQGNRK